MGIQDGLNQCNFEIDSFLMMGQSNMAGRGNIGEVPKIENPLCFMLRMGRWQGMSEPINPDRCIFSTSPYRSGISLAASFADEYANCYQKQIGLIPCADGGTKLSQWMPGEILFDHALMQAKLAMRTSNLKGILWHQGESDCKDPQDLETYIERFNTMITAFRKELNLPELPVIVGELSELIYSNFISNNLNIKFNKQLPLLAQQVPHCTIVPSQGLTLKDDGLHFNSVSCREFGKRYFQAYQTMQEQA